MTIGQVHHMDIIAEAGAVGRRVISAEDGQMVSSAYSHLGDVGHEVIRDALGIFADPSAFMGPDGIEIAEKDDGKLRIGLSRIFQYFFHHHFRPAVRIGTAAALHGFHIGRFIFFPVDSSGRGEDEPRAACFFHTFQQGEGGIYIISIIFKWQAD